MKQQIIRCINSAKATQSTHKKLDTGIEFQRIRISWSGSIYCSEFDIIIYSNDIETSMSFNLFIEDYGKVKIDSLELEPMDKDAAIAFAKNYLIGKINEIL